MDRPGSRRGIKPLNRMVMEMLPKKALSTVLLSSLGRLYLRWPDFTVDTLLCHDSPAADRELLGLEDTRTSTTQMLDYATANLRAPSSELEPSVGVPAVPQSGRHAEVIPLLQGTSR